MKVKVKPEKQEPEKKYRMTIEMRFDDRESKSVQSVGSDEDVSKFMDTQEPTMDSWEDELEDAKDHVTMLMLKVERLS